MVYLLIVLSLDLYYTLKITLNLQEILNSEKLYHEEIKYLLTLDDENDINLLFEKAFAIKHLYFGRVKNRIASIQFSNYCENNCSYCDIRDENLAVVRYRLSPDEILKKIKQTLNKNIINIILQSGADSYYDTDMIAYLIYRIKKEYNISITLDLLQRGYDEYRAWKFAGADSYLLKFNTSNSKEFSIFNRDNKLEERINALRYLKRLGYRICTGNIIGLPNQTIEDLTNDLVLLSSLQPEMVLNTPFIPQKLTKFKNYNPANFNLVLKATAISRILLKKSCIIVSDKNDLLSPDEKKKLFEVGANTLLLDHLSTHLMNESLLSIQKNSFPQIATSKLSN